MRVLHLTASFAPAFSYGGPPRSILGLCRGLQRAGVDVEVFTTTANGASELPASPPGGDRYEGVPVHYFPRVFPRRIFRAPALGATLRRAVARYDLVHVHGVWTHPGWAGAWHARRRGVPYVLSPHGLLDTWSLGHHALRKRIAYRAIERRVLSGAAFAHATADTEAEAIRALDREVPIVTLPNGIDPPPSAGREGAFLKRLGVEPDAPLVVYVGRLHVKKRLDLLAGAFARVHAARPDAHLAVAGPDEGGYRRRVEPLFAAAGASVHWLGELGDAEKWSLLADASALVMCSDSENFGNSVLEALAARVPVVVTRTCPWERVAQAGCGLWVPQTVEAIADGLLEILGDRARARAMGELGLALARSVYSWDAIARAMAERYEAAVDARPRPVPAA